MDDYTRAYAKGIDGENKNLYDAKEDHLLKQTVDQIRKAGSNTFLEVTNAEVSVRHLTVKEFFLESEQSADPSHGHSLDELCPLCRAKSTADRPLKLSEKESHLRMAIAICESFPVFRLRD